MSKLQMILKEDVAGQGRKGEIVNVSEGYARNFLLKGNKAIVATPEELKKIENQKKKAKKYAEEEKEKCLELKKMLESKEIVIAVKVGENGKMFGAITNKELSVDIKEVFGVEIDKKKIECNIKTVGENIATVKLHTEVKAEIKVVIKAK